MSYSISKHIIIVLLFVMSQSVISAEKIDFTGKWQTPWGTVNLKQTGDKVKGNFTGNFAGVIEGNVTGRRLDFKWTQTDKQWGGGYYDLSQDGRSFTGRFGSNQSNSNGAEWNGKLVSKNAEAKSHAELKRHAELKKNESTGIHLELKDDFKEGMQGLLGGFNKRMDDCYLSEPIAGFNHDKRKYKLCTEEQRKVISEYMGTFEGNYSGSSNGKVTISIHDDGVIEGYRETGGVKYPLRGSASFINRPTQNYLQIHVVSVVSAKTINQERIQFRGKIKKDGVLNSNWNGAGKKGSRPGGQIQLRKTAPHKKRVVAKAKEEPKKETVVKPVKPKAPADNTPLFEAARKGDSNKIWKLANKGYDLTAVDQNGATPFQVALKHGHMQAAQTLMAHGSDKNHKDHQGRTPLHYAAIYNVEIIAGALVIGGADPTVKDKSGKTARDWAKEKGNAGVVRMFEALANPKAHPMFQNK